MPYPRASTRSGVLKNVPNEGCGAQVLSLFTCSGWLGFRVKKSVDRRSASSAVFACRQVLRGGMFLRSFCAKCVCKISINYESNEVSYEYH